MDSTSVSGLPGSRMNQVEKTNLQDRDKCAGRLSAFDVTSLNEDVAQPVMSSDVTKNDSERIKSLCDKFSVVTVSPKKTKPEMVSRGVRLLHNAFEQLMKNDLGICTEFVNPSKPHCDNNYSPHFFRFLPVVSGITIDAIFVRLLSVSGMAVEDCYELAGSILKDGKVKAGFSQLIVSTFAVLNDTMKPSADHLMKAYQKEPDGYYDAIVNGIISHRKSLSRLQVAVDKNQLTQGFPTRYFPMLFGSKEDYYLGPDAHNFGANTIHTLCGAFGELLEQLSLGSLQSLDLGTFCQIHKGLTKSVKTDYGEALSPTDSFFQIHLYSIPKEKFTQHGFLEVIQFVNECGGQCGLPRNHVEQALMFELSRPGIKWQNFPVPKGFKKPVPMLPSTAPDPLNPPFFNICGSGTEYNEKYPGKVTIRAFSGECKKNKVEKVFDDYKAELEKSTSDHDVRLAIAKMAKRLIMLHYFLDGNRRTIVFVINRELLRNGQSCSIILDADSITAKSSAEFSQVIKEGQDRFMGIQRNKHATFFNPPIPCFHDQVQSKVYGYIEQGWKEMQKYTDIDDLDLY